MRLSSNHKVPTVLLGQAKTKQPVDNSPFGMGDWPSPPPEFHSTVNPSQNRPAPLTSDSRTHQPLSPQDDADFVADYWEINSANDVPTTSKDRTFDYTADDPFWDGEPFEDNRFISSETENSDSTYGATANAEPYGSDIYELEADCLETDIFDDQRPVDTDLDDLFEAAGDGWQASPEAGVSYRRRTRGARSIRQRQTKQPLSQALLKAASAKSSGDYLNILSEILAQAILQGKGSARCETHLNTLQLMAKRYATHGFSEHSILSDAVEIHNPDQGPDLLPVLTGLAVRVILKPHLIVAQPSPTQLKQLFLATRESVKRLAAGRQLKALPRLVTRLAQRPQPDRHAFDQLPKQLHRATIRVTQNLQLYEQLCCESPPERPAPTAGNGSVQLFHTHGPVEIFIRPLHDESS